MPLCSFSKDSALMDVTPVENIFISEYMLGAPGDFVKVYLYGLMQCHYPAINNATMTSFASALGLDETNVRDAFRYWQRRSLLRIVSEDPFSAEYFSIKAQVFNGAMTASGAPVYQYAQLNKKLQDLFAGRMFSVSDYQKIYDWIEVYGLSESVVIKLVEFCIALKGHSIRLSYIDKVAMEWADKQIDTAEKAQEHIAMNELKTSGANKVLRHLGLKRNPTLDECRLYDKWSNDWGFTLDVVLCACREMTKINNPNFAYIDRILSAYRAKGLVSVAKIEAYTQEREATKGAITHILDILDIKGAPKSAQVNMYNKWLRDYGVSLETIYMCAEQAKLTGNASFQEVDWLLSSIAQSGAASPAQAKAKLNDIFSLEKNISIAYERAGIRRLPTPPERAQFDKWLKEQKLPFELVFLAAEYSAGTQSPFQFLKKILENWHDEGITSVSAAKAAHKKRRYKAVDITENDDPELSQYSDEELLKTAYSPSRSTEE